MATAVLKKMPAADADGALMELDVASITVAGDNPRRTIGDVAELAQSIAGVGLIEPLVVTPRVKPGEGIMFLLVAGHRRLAAAKEAGLKSVPCYVRRLEEPERVAAMLIENLQREDLTPLEEAGAYKRLVDEFEMPQRELGEKVGRSQGHISKRLALLDLPKNVQAAVDSGGITLAEAGELAKLKDHPARLASAFSQGTRWRGQYARAVKDQLEEMELEAKIERAQTELREKGVKVVSFKKGSYRSWELPNGVVEIGSWEARSKGLEKVTVANHKNEPCHAAAIRPRDGEIIYVCTKPAAHKGQKLETPADEKDKQRKEREREKAAQLKAREDNIELGRLLEAKLAAPKIDMRNMRMLANAFMEYAGAEIAWAGLRFTDEASQTVVSKKDGSVSRIVHVDRERDARAILTKKLNAATTPEEIMGGLLQALIAARKANVKAAPASRRYTYVRCINDRITDYLDTVAKQIGIGKPAAARATKRVAKRSPRA